MKDVPRVVNQLVKNAYSLPEVLSEKEEMAALKDALEFFKKEFSCEVAVDTEEKSSHPRAKNAMPGKPAIVLE
jgi:hypothetical protein